jgi:hypothetical protein
VLVYKPEDDIDVPRLFKGVQKEEEFVELATTLAEDDRLADEIQRDEEEYFHDSRSGEKSYSERKRVSL